MDINNNFKSKHERYAAYQAYLEKIHEMFPDVACILSADIASILRNYYVMSELEHFESVIMSGRVKIYLRNGNSRVIDTVTFNRNIVCTMFSTINHFNREYSDDVYMNCLMDEYDADGLKCLIDWNLDKLFGCDVMDKFDWNEILQKAEQLSVMISKRFVRSAKQLLDEL